MDYQHVVQNLSPDVVSRLRKSLETGRWPDGRELTAQQKEDTLQALIAWDEAHLPKDQRVGFIDNSKLGKKSSSKIESETLRWADSKDSER